MKNRSEMWSLLHLKVLILILVLMTIGCAQVSIRSIKDQSFSDPINKMYIIVNQGQAGATCDMYLVQALDEEFSKIDVETEIRVVDPLVLDESVYLAEATAYEPDGVLTIVATGGTVSQYGGMIKIIYDVSVFDQLTQKRIWRAQIDNSGGTAVVEKRMDLMALDLVKRLTDDKIIGSTPRLKGSNI